MLCDQVKKSMCHSVNIRHDNQLTIPKHRSAASEHYFSYGSVSTYNAIPAEIRSKSNMFTTHFKTYLLHRQISKPQLFITSRSPPRFPVLCVDPILWIFRNRGLIRLVHKANEETQKKKAQNDPRKLEFGDSILEIARIRSDGVAKAVIVLKEAEFDLAAIEAKYHNNYYNIFLRLMKGY
nr:unnamed protein product [Callosobruchus chinensis]